MGHSAVLLDLLPGPPLVLLDLFSTDTSELSCCTLNLYPVVHEQFAVALEAFQDHRGHRKWLPCLSPRGQKGQPERGVLKWQLLHGD
eukprot:1161728-Pelagomonas_calceolata.AAC.5